MFYSIDWIVFFVSYNNANNLFLPIYLLTLFSLFISSSSFVCLFIYPSIPIYFLFPFFPLLLSSLFSGDQRPGREERGLYQRVVQQGRISAAGRQKQDHHYQHGPRGIESCPNIPSSGTRSSASRPKPGRLNQRVVSLGGRSSLDATTSGQAASHKTGEPNAHPLIITHHSCRVAGSQSPHADCNMKSGDWSRSERYFPRDARRRWLIALGPVDHLRPLNRVAKWIRATCITSNLF